MSQEQDSLSLPSPALDPMRHPELYEGIIFRRVVAYVIDVVIVTSLFAMIAFASFVLGFLTFGLSFSVTWLVLVLIPFAYHSVLVAGPKHATLGMRNMGIEVRVWNTGASPEFPQAAVLALLFYASIALTIWVIVVVAIFSNARRCLHDYFSGTVVVNKLNGRVAEKASGPVSSGTDISVSSRPGVPE